MASGIQHDQYHYRAVVGHLLAHEHRTGHLVFTTASPDPRTRASQKALAGKLDENVTICGSLDDSVSAIISSSGVADKSTVSLMKNGTQSDLTTGKITFPYVFPRPGKYLIYVQVSHLGEIKTAGFEYSVQ